jgi:hypothetical protein
LLTELLDPIAIPEKQQQQVAPIQYQMFAQLQ